MMFQFSRPESGDIQSAIASIGDRAGFHLRLLSLTEGLHGRELPFGYAHDAIHIRIGKGEHAFAVARAAFTRWTEFDLGWVRVANPEVPIAPGSVVAVEVHACGLWSLNLSRIVETIDTAHQFGFLYATTPHHAEQGEEIFRLEFDPGCDSVWYHLEAVSRPRHAMARIAYPLTRALQHRFARDSQRRMRAAVLDEVSTRSY